MLPIDTRLVEQLRALAAARHLEIGQLLARWVEEELERAEDADDLTASDAALREPGESIPWEQVKTELGL